MNNPTIADVERILEDEFESRVFSVEEGIVWVSGMNVNPPCPSLARRMANTLVHTHDIPCGLVYDDDAVRFGGVQFNWGGRA